MRRAAPGRSTSAGAGPRRTAHSPSISAAKLDAHVIEHVKAIYADGQGAASRAQEARDAAIAAEAAQTALEEVEERFMLLPKGASHKRALAVVEKRTAEVAALREKAQRLASVEGVEVVNAAEVLDDTDPAALPAKRGLIKLALAKIIVGPGRASVAERVSFEPLR